MCFLAAVAIPEAEAVVTRVEVVQVVAGVAIQVVGVAVPIQQQRIAAIRRIMKTFVAHSAVKASTRFTRSKAVKWPLRTVL